MVSSNSLIFILYLVYFSAAVQSTKYYKDFSTAETLLLHYYNYAGKLRWKWSVNAFCRIICPGKLRVESEYTYIEDKRIMLESSNCTPIEVEMLICGCGTKKFNRTDLALVFDWFALVNGLNGEIYQVAPPEVSKCGDDKTYIIHGEVVRNENSSVQPLQLGGVGRIFEEFVRKDFNILYMNGSAKSGGESESDNELEDLQIRV